MNVDLDAKIPNNVNLKDDKRLQRALEKWLPQFREWWSDMGPSDFNTNDVYLRNGLRDYNAHLFSLSATFEF